MGTIFETDRLVARTFTEADLAAFVAYRADPEVARYQSWSAYTTADGSALIEQMQQLEPGTPGEWVQIALEHRESATLVGDLAMCVDADEPRVAEMGFTLAREHQERGYATEAVRGLLSFAFETLGLHRVVAITDARNAPCVAVLERVGLRREAHLVENVFFKGEWGSEFVYALLARECSSGHVTATRVTDGEVS